MKIFKLKNRLISIVGIIAILGAMIASIFVGVVDVSASNKAAAETDHYSDAMLTEYSNQVVAEIKAKDYVNVPDSYSLRENYPIYTEQQNPSSLCWAFSANKVLETTLMVNTGEYYNFSEIGLGYLAYLDGKSATIKGSNSFSQFDNTIRDKGVIMESSFSNDIMNYINEDNHENYDYILDFVDSNVDELVRPIYLSLNSNFNHLTTDFAKHCFIKYYIQNYGGLNMVLPSFSERIGENTIVRYGMFYTHQLSSLPTYSYTVDDSGKYLGENHAVCLIGWNSYGFVGLNSWGVDAGESYEEVTIPYDVMADFYRKEYIVTDKWLCGYDYVQDSKVTVHSTEANEFSETIVENSTNPMKNAFCYTEPVSVTYKVSGVSNFETIYTSIYKGTEDVTDKFTISYNDATNLVTVSYNPIKNNFSSGEDKFYDGGCYAVYFYEDVNLISARNLVVYSGTEVSYFKLTNDTTSEPDYYSMMNSWVSSTNTATYYINWGSAYFLEFYLTEYNTSGTTEISPFIFQVYNESTGLYESASSSEFGIQYNSGESFGNRHLINVRYIDAKYIGKLIRFNFSLVSPEYGTLCKRAYSISLYVSAESVASTTNAKPIIYNLDGGRNSEKNQSIYPNFSQSTIYTITVFDAITSRTGYVFGGWYLSPDFSGEKVLRINLTSDQAGPIVLYAKWIYTNVDYFSLSLQASKIYNHDKTEKTLQGDLSEKVTLTYGESFEFNTRFNLTDELKSKSFSFKYYYYVNGELIEAVDLIEDSDEVTVLSEYVKTYGGLSDSVFTYPNLEVGEYYIRIVAAVVISHEYSMSDEVDYTVEVNPKTVTINYDATASTKHLYDAEYHLPKAAFAGYYSEHSAEFAEVKFNQKAQMDAGEYNYTVVDITNDNYVLEEEFKTRYYLLKISPKPLTLIWSGVETTYNSKLQAPTCEVEGLIGEDTIRVVFNVEGYRDAGEYEFIIKTSNNPNYAIPVSQIVNFKINKATIVVTFDDVEERAQSSAKHRTGITFKYDPKQLKGDDKIEDLNISGTSVGLTETEAGEYPIIGSYESDNYIVEFAEGSYYTLTGWYYVQYLLPNGEIYREKVNYGETPKGITDEVYKVSKLKKLEYSEELVETGDDIYITVTVKDYTWYVLIAAAVVILLIIYWVGTRRVRKNKVR